MYVHGFGSSGQSGTVTLLRTLMPAATVIAPDLPLHPAEALELLKQTCDAEKPDLIIGTSMGGMYAEMLRGTDRILINPRFRDGRHDGETQYGGQTNLPKSANRRHTRLYRNQGLGKRVQGNYNTAIRRY